MNEFNKSVHAIYECRYHIIFTTKYRIEVLVDGIREFTMRAIHELCDELDHVVINDLNISNDHIHLNASIPPKYSISSFMGFLKGRLASMILNKYKKLKKKFWGGHLWSRGYFVRTIGLNEDKVREYIKNQEKVCEV